MIHGIDVSSYQPVAFATTGLDFVFVKATEGTTYVSPNHKAQVEHARSAGLVVGHYHFGHNSPTAEAAYFAQHAGVQPGDIIAYDWEATNANQGDRDIWIKAVKAKFPNNKVVLYCDKSYWTSKDTESYCGDGLWIADPSSAAGKPAIQHAWVFHQYSSTGGLDHNVANFASRSALETWAAAPKPAPAPVSTPAPVSAPTPTALESVKAELATLQKDVAALATAIGKLT